MAIWIFRLTERCPILFWNEDSELCFIIGLLVPDLVLNPCHQVLQISKCCKYHIAFPWQFWRWHHSDTLYWLKRWSYSGNPPIQFFGGCTFCHHLFWCFKFSQFNYLLIHKFWSTVEEGRCSYNCLRNHTESFWSQVSVFVHEKLYNIELWNANFNIIQTDYGHYPEDLGQIYMLHAPILLT